MSDTVAAAFCTASIWNYQLEHEYHCYRFQTKQKKNRRIWYYIHTCSAIYAITSIRIAQIHILSRSETCGTSHWRDKRHIQCHTLRFNSRFSCCWCLFFFTMLLAQRALNLHLERKKNFSPVSKFTFLLIIPLLLVYRVFGSWLHICVRHCFYSYSDCARACVCVCVCVCWFFYSVLDFCENLRV